MLTFTTSDRDASGIYINFLFFFVKVIIKKHKEKKLLIKQKEKLKEKRNLLFIFVLFLIRSSNIYIYFHSFIFFNQRIYIYWNGEIFYLYSIQINLKKKEIFSLRLYYLCALFVLVSSYVLLLFCYSMCYSISWKILLDKQTKKHFLTLTSWIYIFISNKYSEVDFLTEL